MAEHVCEGAAAPGSGSESEISKSSGSDSDGEEALMAVADELAEYRRDHSEALDFPEGLAVHLVYRTVHRNVDGLPACDSKANHLKYAVYKCGEAGTEGPTCMRKACGA